MRFSSLAVRLSAVSIILICSANTYADSKNSTHKELQELKGKKISLQWIHWGQAKFNAAIMKPQVEAMNKSQIRRDKSYQPLFDHVKLDFHGTELIVKPVITAIAVRKDIVNTQQLIVENLKNQLNSPTLQKPSIKKFWINRKLMRAEKDLKNYSNPTHKMHGLNSFDEWHYVHEAIVHKNLLNRNQLMDHADRMVTVRNYPDLALKSIDKAKRYNDDAKAEIKKQLETYEAQLNLTKSEKQKAEIQNQINSSKRDLENIAEHENYISKKREEYLDKARAAKVDTNGYSQNDLDKDVGGFKEMGFDPSKIGTLDNFRREMLGIRPPANEIKGASDKASNSRSIRNN